MKWLETKVNFESMDNKGLATELISNIFFDLGLQGVVIEDPDIKTEKGWGIDALPFPENDAVIGYLPLNTHTGKKCELLVEQLKRLKNDIDIRYWISYRQMDEKDWAESWKAYFWPQKVGKCIIVKPTWREYDPRPQEIVLEIDPGMAFGTGTHPTTRLCIRMIEKYLKKGESFLDIGTGSGILVIAAAKLGAGKLLGIDIDEVAVDTAWKNLRLNHINPEIFTIRTGDLLENVKDTYDIITANILSEVILTLLLQIEKVLKKNGLFICSGISEENQMGVIENMRKMGFKICEVLKEEGWVSIAGRLS